MSDEREKEQKMEENEEKSVHGGIKDSACVSLYCTKQSQAEHLSFFSIYLEKNGVGEEERGRGMEKCWEEREREACGGLKYSPRLRRSEPSKITNQKKTRI